MKERFLLFLILSFLLISCTTAPKSSSAPKWLTDVGRLSAFPREKYICALASNKSAEIAKQEAAAEISRFIKSEITSKTSVTQTAQKSNDSYRESRSLDSEIEIFSTETLYGLEYTTPYFVEKENRYYCVAYIEKQNAWKLVKAELERLESDILNAVENSKTAGNSFAKTIFLLKAKKSGDKFYNAYYFGLVVNDKETRKFDSAVKILSNLHSEIAKEKPQNTVLVKVENDNGDFIFQKISDILDNNGFFPVQQNSNVFEDELLESKKTKFTLTANCTVNIKPDGEIFSCAPGIKIEVTENDSEKIVYTFSESTNRVAGKTQEAAKKIAYRELGKILENKFINYI